MSDQPDDQHNLEHHIPGLQQAVTNLSNTASASGYRVATIVITQQNTRDGAPAPPTRITFAAPIAEPQSMAATTQPPERWISGPPPSHQWRPGEPLPSMTQIQPVEHHPPPPPPPPPAPPPPLPARTQQHPSPTARSKRASTSLIETGDGASAPSPPVEKRKRFSDPTAPLPGLTSGAFWGTVLEERPGAPAGMMPSQIAPPQQPPSTQPAQRILHVMRPQQQQLPVDEIQPAHPVTEQDRVQRSTTFPALRIQSSITQRQGQHILPLLPEQLAATAGATYPERHPSPEITTTAHSRRQTERGFLRRAAGQLLGRLSPFGGGPALSRPSASRSPVTEDQLFRQRQLTTSGLPAIVPTPQIAAPEMFAHAPRDRPFDVPQLAPLQGYQPQQAPIGQQSGSRSASGSGVSHARPSRNTSSPQAVSGAEGSRAPRSEAVSRGKRGRKAGVTPDRDQYFECELCDSKFRRKSDKNRHVRVVHEKSRPFVCPMCEKTFGEKSNMLKHRASVHDDVRKFRCPYCDITFSQRGVCDSHVRTVHDKKQAKYFCEHCGLPFSRKVQLHEHYETVHPEYMATYGRYQTGQASGQPSVQPSSAPTMTTSSRTVRREPMQERGSAGASGQAFPSPEGTGQPGPSSLPLQRIEGGPSEPQQWLQYPQTSQTVPSTEMQQLQQESTRQRSFQGESSGGNGG